jgi:antimicrobial peptide system SdpB family protein
LRVVRNLQRRVFAGLGDYEPRVRSLAIGRTVLALAQLSILVFTPWRDLFPEASGLSDAHSCSGTAQLSLWCLTSQNSYSVNADCWIAIAVLIWVASGYRPRWSCIPHWYISFGMATSMFAPNGGDMVAALVTLLLAPVLLADDRRWQWQPPTRPLSPTARGRARALMLLLRLQVVIIYAVAGLSKVLTASWLHGDAMLLTFQDPYFGLPTVLRRTNVFDSWLLGSTVGWVTIVAELSLSCCLLGSGASRRIAVALSVLLHVLIMVLMGLVSFGLIMIGTVVLVAGLATPGATERLGSGRTRGEKPHAVGRAQVPAG